MPLSLPHPRPTQTHSYRRKIIHEIFVFRLVGITGVLVNFKSFVSVEVLVMACCDSSHSGEGTRSLLHSLRVRQPLEAPRLVVRRFGPECHVGENSLPIVLGGKSRCLHDLFREALRDDICELFRTYMRCCWGHYFNHGVSLGAGAYQPPLKKDKTAREFRFKQNHSIYIYPQRTHSRTHRHAQAQSFLDTSMRPATHAHKVIHASAYHSHSPAPRSQALPTRHCQSPDAASAVPRSS